MPVTNSNQEQGGVCSCPLRYTHFEHITCGKEFIQAHDWDQEFCAQPMGGGNRCGHDRACHAPTREQRLQQHIAERDAFLAEDALSAASEPARCETCNGTGFEGTRTMQDGSYEDVPCRDCWKTTAASEPVDERALFQAAVIKKYTLAKIAPKHFERTTDGRYVWDWVGRLWEGWEMRAAIASTHSQSEEGP
jgi:hypothetical protein